jgi:hypothetical protein
LVIVTIFIDIVWNVDIDVGVVLVVGTFVLEM